MRPKYITPPEKRIKISHKEMKEAMQKINEENLKLRMSFRTDAKAMSLRACPRWMIEQSIKTK